MTRGAGGDDGAVDPLSTPVPVAAGSRIAWEEVPGQVRGDVEAALGSPVVSARTQHGGFSPEPPRGSSAPTGAEPSSRRAAAS